MNNGPGTDSPPEEIGRHTSLLAGGRTLLALLPRWSRRSIVKAIVYSFLLAALEFVAIVLLFPVFGFLAQHDTASMRMPGIGIVIDRSSARTLAIGALGVLVVRSALTLVYRTWWLHHVARAEVELSDRILRGYAYAPYSFHIMTPSSELMAKAVANVNFACQSGLVGLVGMVSTALLSAGLALALVLASPIAGLAVTAYVSLLGLLYVYISRRRTRALAEELEHRVGRVYVKVSTLLRGIREITIFGQRDEYLDTIKAARSDMADTNSKVLLLQDVPRTVLEVTLYSTILVALAILLSLDNPDKVLPLVALYVVAGLRIMPTLGQLLGNVSSARAGTRMAERLSTAMDSLYVNSTYGAPSTANGDPRETYPKHASLCFDNVGYRYSVEGPEVLSDFSLTVPFGEYLGVVGPSGAGKTTLISLVLGLLTPSSGGIRYGDTRLRSNDSDWYAKVAVLPQDVFLTDGSLLDNILAGDVLQMDRIKHCVELAGLRDLVDQLDEGLDTRLLESGGRLSAGQRQRVGLARAIYRRPEVLVLDEPTSALDATTEHHIVQSIEDLKGSMTILAVAHRTHTLLGTDRIIRLDTGRIAAVGRPSEVLQP